MGTEPKLCLTTAAAIGGLMAGQLRGLAKWHCCSKAGVEWNLG